MIFAYFKSIQFVSSFTGVLCAWYTWNFPLLVVSSYLVSNMANSTGQTFESQCPDWYGLDGLRRTRPQGIAYRWSLCQCAAAISLETLLRSLNGGCNILSAGYIAAKYLEPSMGSQILLRYLNYDGNIRMAYIAIIKYAKSTLISKHSLIDGGKVLLSHLCKNGHGLSNGICDTCIVALAIMTMFLHDEGKSYSKFLIVLILMSGILALPNIAPLRAFGLLF